MVIRNKAYGCVTRRVGGALQVLVFDQPQGPNPQLPGGTVEDGEDTAAAVLREVFEESGLTGLTVVALLGVREKTFPNERHVRHFFHLATARALPDRWAHTVTGGEEDAGMVFAYHWLPAEQARRELAADLGMFLDKLGE